MNFKTCCLTLHSQKYNGQVDRKVGKWVKRMGTQIKTALFTPSDLTSVLSLLRNFKTAHDSNGIPKGAAMWLFPHFIKEPARDTLAHRISASVEDNGHEDRNDLKCLVVTFWFGINEKCTVLIR